ncbi:hypothetical protein OAL09_03330 [Verrucomicrobia bacterium]|nr:hypothetical protein [Verrucomicrobiota bacterium]
MQTESKKYYFFALIFGYVGLFLCVLGMIFVVVSSRKVDNSNKKIFATLNEILETVEERKNEVRVRFDITVKTVISVKEKLEQWSNDKEKEVSHEDKIWLDKKLEELLILLSQADQWMELSQSSLQVVNQAIELANSSGASIETTLTKRIFEEVSSVRESLTQLTEEVESIDRQFSVNEKFDINEIILGSVFDFSDKKIASVDIALGHLKTLDNEIAKAKQSLDRYKNKISAWIRNICILMVLIITWMAIGQLSLSTIGWVFKLREEALKKKNGTDE